MTRYAPLFADDKTAAGLFCMKPAEFRQLVEDGALPKPVRIGGFDRWDVEQLQSIARGDAADGMGHIKW